MEISLLESEPVLLKQRGTLNFTHPENRNITVAYVHGIFHVTDKQLLFVQDSYSSNSPDVEDKRNVAFDICLSEVIKVNDDLSASISMCLQLGTISITSHNWMDFCDQLQEEAK